MCIRVSVSVYVPVNDLESLWALSVVLYDPTGVLVLVLDSMFVNVLGVAVMYGGGFRNGNGEDTEKSEEWALLGQN